MQWKPRGLAVAVVLAMTVASGGRAVAQGVTAVPPGGTLAQPGLAATPFALPGTNAFMNPYYLPMQSNVDMLMYMNLQNQRNGGIGSGVISGYKAAPAATTGPGSPAPAATAAPAGPRNGSGQTNRTSGRSTYPTPDRQFATMPATAQTPGGNTGGYFLRGPRAAANGVNFFDRMTPTRANNRR